MLVQQIYEAVGGKFHDENKKIMKGPLVFITGIGGILIENRTDGSYILNKKINTDSMFDIVMSMAGASAFMSYLNPSNLELSTLGEKVVSQYNHTSVLHPISLNIVLVGHSIGVEHELSTQRDLLHLSRLTVAKTDVQDSPCLTLRNPELLPYYEKAIADIDAIVKSTNSKDKESLNLLFPNAKSSMIMLSGSIKNFLKVVDMRNQSGKEDELIDILNKTNDVLSSLMG